MSGPAGLQEHLGGLTLGDEAPEACAGEAMPGLHVPRPTRDGNLENSLCQVDADLGSVHTDSSSTCGLRGRCCFVALYGAVVGEESIPSAEPDAGGEPVVLLQLGRAG